MGSVEVLAPEDVPKPVGSGGPVPGVGCAGRVTIASTRLPDENGVRGAVDRVSPDALCDGSARPLRKTKAPELSIGASGEMTAPRAASNIFGGLQRHGISGGVRLGILV
jgi:nitrogenase iron protein NifH